MSVEYESVEVLAKANSLLDIRRNNLRGVRFQIRLICQDSLSLEGSVYFLFGDIGRKLPTIKDGLIVLAA